MEIDEEAADQSLRQEGFGPDGYYHHHHRSHHHHHHHHQRRISQEGANGQWYRSKIEEDPEDDSNVEGLDASLLSGSPPGDYTDQLPDWNELMAKFRESAGSHGSSSRHRDPPMLPPHLSNVLLNSADPPKNDVNVLPVPNHVVLNHLYACSIKDNVMAVSTTSRYRGKYLTTIYYKPV
ncbi:galactose metabolism- protein [Spiromyces aspiralis]|uniref:Galactose metabolism- protein n=1 Tax=Spiromyces aspiralis TaxID=68401 RepID=A0ACC1HRZ3_9FUNG|nr:galactose metabolism- protein [Spiromyces aspiralis]